jgi:transcriptional regulator with XRE-family HTH domain/tetratricopeptide (TPR) repeat protein
VVGGPAAEQAGLGFGGLLRRLRDDAGLTQDELAEAAGVSQRAVSDLERGINATARKDTALLLAAALGLDGQARDLFVAAARGRAPASEALAAAAGAGGSAAAGAVALVGRERELSLLLGALGGDARLLLVVGDAGVGKTRFAGEVMTRAAAAGMVMVRGECLPLASTLPLLPVAAALGELDRLEGGTLLEAALNAAPLYVRGEVGRLLPRLGPGSGPGPGGRGEGWRRERLFSAVAELLDAVARESAVGLVIEDVHWADSATLDCLTFLARVGRGLVTVVVTCRGDEAPVKAHVADWLTHVRGAAGVKEIRLDPLSRAEVADQVAALAGGPVPPRVVDELYARAEGNPFFTEQLVAAALARAAGGGLHAPAGLPARLADLLAARAGRCAGDARAVLAALAVAGRPVAEGLLGSITELDAAAVRRGLGELAAARLLADDTAGGAHRPRHALLAEAVADGLLPGERAVLHERIARTLQTAGGEVLAAEVAGHWQAAGSPAGELPARVAAAAAAERVFGYVQAAAHWLRAIELCRAQPGIAGVAGLDVPRLYLRATEALEVSGDSVAAGLVAEEAYGRFADHPDAATAAIVQQRAGFFRGIDAPAAGLPLMEEALRLFDQAPPSADHAEAWLSYSWLSFCSSPAEGRSEARLTTLNRALEVAEAAGATALIPRVLAGLADDAFMRGQVDEGFAFLRRGQTLAEEAAGDGEGSVRLAVFDSDALLKTGQFDSAAEAAQRGLQAARRTGREASFDAAVLAANAAEAMLARGHTAEAAALLDPLTTGPPNPDHWLMHELRAEIDLLRGDADAAAERQQQINAVGRTSIADLAHEAAQRAAELALWAGRPGDALHQARRVLASFKTPYLTIFCGRLLTAGVRACADLAEQARARRDDRATRAAMDAAAELTAWTDQMGGVPLGEHPYVATIPAERATWDAEQTRLAGASDPAAWGAAAKAWQDLGCPHRAGYAWWRQAQAQLTAGQPATAAAAALRAAARAAEGHARTCWRRSARWRSGPGLRCRTPRPPRMWPRGRAKPACLSG